MATGKVKQRDKCFVLASFSYKDTSTAGIAKKGSKTYTKTNLGYSVPSGASATLMGIRRFGDSYWAHPYGINNSSNLLHEHNFVGGFANTNATVYFVPVFLKEG